MMDFKSKLRPCYIAATEQNKNSKFLAINHTPVSFDKEAYRGNKKIPTRFTIIRPLSAGWGSAPYKQHQKGVAVKRLSEITSSTEQGASVKMYSFEKVSSNMEKGPRCDDITFEIRTGNTLNFWLDEKRLEELKRNPSMGQMDKTINEFTLCEIQVSSKNKDGALKGSGCKITEIKPCSFTLYSCVEVILCCRFLVY
jgi:hypothetical protein